MKYFNFSRVIYVFTAVLFFTASFSGCMNETLEGPGLEDQEAAVSDDFHEMGGEYLRISPAEQNKILAGIRGATAKYHRLEVAEASGYDLDTHCVEVPGLGGMGHHAVNFVLIDGEVNPLMPEVLVYEPSKNGKYQLVAVEYLVDAGAWHGEDEDREPPMIGGVPFDDHRNFLEKGGPPFPHYQLHIWVWKNNPNGLYAPFNPNVKCP
ncbi:hypothetical protein [Negadavirga shengliensis]|uniref:Uncharacterized protein n=1 Tax=Negadavirga shengliensis TaxID=1389218 RepID=A0ABV9T0T8_9BACT